MGVHHRKGKSTEKNEERLGFGVEKVWRFRDVYVGVALNPRTDAKQAFGVLFTGPRAAAAAHDLLVRRMRSEAARRRARPPGKRNRERRVLNERDFEDLNFPKASWCDLCGIVLAGAVREGDEALARAEGKPKKKEMKEKKEKKEKKKMKEKKKKKKSSAPSAPTRLDPDLDSILCPACGRGDEEETFVLCESCLQGGHVACLEIEGVPEGNWLCQDCVGAFAERDRKRRKKITEEKSNPEKRIVCYVPNEPRGWPVRVRTRA